MSCSSAAGWSSGVLSATKLYHSVSDLGAAGARESQAAENLPDVVDHPADGVDRPPPLLPRRKGERPRSGRIRDLSSCATEIRLGKAVVHGTSSHVRSSHGWPRHPPPGAPRDSSRPRRRSSFDTSPSLRPRYRTRILLKFVGICRGGDRRPRAFRSCEGRRSRIRACRSGPVPSRPRPEPPVRRGVPPPSASPEKKCPRGITHGPLVLQRRLRPVRQGGKGVRTADGQVGERLAVEFHSGAPKSVHEA